MGIDQARKVHRNLKRKRALEQITKRTNQLATLLHHKQANMQIR